METHSALLAICAGNSSVTGEFSAQWPVTRSFDIWINDWVNNGEAGDLRRHRARHDVIVMVWRSLSEALLLTDEINQRRAQSMHK